MSLKKSRGHLWLERNWEKVLMVTALAIGASIAIVLSVLLSTPILLTVGLCISFTVLAGAIGLLTVNLIKASQLIKGHKHRYSRAPGHQASAHASPAVHEIEKPKAISKWLCTLKGGAPKVQVKEDPVVAAIAHTMMMGMKIG